MSLPNASTFSLPKWQFQEEAKVDNNNEKEPPASIGGDPEKPSFTNTTNEPDLVQNNKLEEEDGINQP